MTCANNEKQFREEEIDDIDYNALYPSAMRFFDGFLKGTPKRINTTDYEQLKNYDGYFLKVRINEVGKHRAFPVMCYTDKANMKKNWTNNMEGRIVFFDK